VTAKFFNEQLPGGAALSDALALELSDGTRSPAKTSTAPAVNAINRLLIAPLRFAGIIVRRTRRESHAHTFGCPIAAPKMVKAILFGSPVGDCRYSYL
jgi:hypothetical protein